MTASIEKASGRSLCRGKDCGYGRKIPEGSKCLRVYIYAAGGSAVAFYCEKCMIPVLDSFIKAINDSEKDLE